MSVDFVCGSPFVSYDGMDATIQVDMKIITSSPEDTVTCKLLRGDQEIVSINCKLYSLFRYEFYIFIAYYTGISGSFLYTVREEGNYEFLIDAFESIGLNRAIIPFSVQVNFN